ncbi:MAG: hypothetical protein J7599_18245, partial [Niabella sp.]|nr:hypothetical protein [Niabella sp.]
MPPKRHPYKLVNTTGLEPASRLIRCIILKELYQPTRFVIYTPFRGCKDMFSFSNHQKNFNYFLM